MIEKIIIALRQGVSYIEDHPQLLMTLVLVIVIPVAFIINAQQFLIAAHTNQERLEKDRVGLLHDVFSSFIIAANFDPAVIQRELVRIAELNPDITKFHVLHEEGDTLRIIASLVPDAIGTIPEDPSSYRVANVTPDESIISAYAQYGIRYWQGFRLLRASDAQVYYVFTETSLQHIDELFASHIMSAYYWLIGLVIVIFALLARHVRLIDYSYLYRQMQKADEMKDLYTNMIAHELRAPLTAMRGYASLIRERSGLPDDVHTHAVRIEEASTRLVFIVNDLLDVARIQSGKMNVSEEETHISDIVRSVIEELEVSAREKGITLAHDNAHGDVLIMGDPKRLHQALTNLVSNAIKYTKKGSITVSLDDRTDRVELRVKDTGMGIAAENQRKMFAPFFRVNSDDVSAITGTGLGMWITKQLIELMGGSIAVESIKGVGTHVVVVLPKKR